MDDIKKKVIDIIAQNLGVKVDAVVDSAHFIDDLGADSLNTIELTMALEEEFDFEISEDDGSKLLTVKDMLDYISKSI